MFRSISQFPHTSFALRLFVFQFITQVEVEFMMAKLVLVICIVFLTESTTNHQ